MGMLSHFAVCMMFLLLNSVVVLLWSSACPPPAHLGVALSGLESLGWRKHRVLGGWRGAERLCQDRGACGGRSGRLLCASSSGC